MVLWRCCPKALCALDTQMTSLAVIKRNALHIALELGSPYINTTIRILNLYDILRSDVHTLVTQYDTFPQEWLSRLRSKLFKPDLLSECGPGSEPLSELHTVCVPAGGSAVRKAEEATEEVLLP